MIQAERLGEVFQFSVDWSVCLGRVVQSASTEQRAGRGRKRKRNGRQGKVRQKENSGKSRKCGECGKECKLFLLAHDFL